MKLLTSNDAVRQKGAGIFDSYLNLLKTAEAELYQRARKDIPGRLNRWKGTWINAYGQRYEVKRSDILQFGLLLGRVAEFYLGYDVAEDVLDRLAEAARRREPWIPHAPSVLITAGEFKRRVGDLDGAERRFREAVQILEQDLDAGESRRLTHKELGRVFYELAYVNRLRGDAGATRSTLERSEADCWLAEDALGAEIARSLLGAVSYEEGFAASAVATLKACLSRFELLVDDPAVKAAGRSGFARRWLVNARIHLGQAYLAAGDPEAARPLIESQLAEMDREPMPAFLATLKRVEAQLRLAEGKVSLAQSAIAASWNAIEGQGGLDSTELAAATVAITGVTHALTGSTSSADSCFDQACMLPSDLHNRRAQAWAWAGRAILARESGDRRSSLVAIRKGLDLVQRSGAPIRAFLLEMLRSSYTQEGGAKLCDLKALVCRTG